MMRSMIETHTRVMACVDRNCESRFEHADCKYNQITLTMFLIQATIMEILKMELYKPY